MNQLALLPPEPAELTIEADAERTRRYIDASRAEATRKAYRSDFRIFTDWCRSRGLSSIPAAPQTIADFLTWEADAGRRSRHHPTAMCGNRLRSQVGRIQKPSDQGRDRRGSDEGHPPPPRHSTQPQGASDA